VAAAAAVAAVAAAVVVEGTATVVTVATVAIAATVGDRNALRVRRVLQTKPPRRRARPGASLFKAERPAANGCRPFR
jgi:hypothetical protein